MSARGQAVRGAFNAEDVRRWITQLPDYPLYDQCVPMLRNAGVNFFMNGWRSFGICALRDTLTALDGEFIRYYNSAFLECSRPRRPTDPYVSDDMLVMRFSRDHVLEEVHDNPGIERADLLSLLLRSFPHNAEDIHLQKRAKQRFMDVLKESRGAIRAGSGAGDTRHYWPRRTSK